MQPVSASLQTGSRVQLGGKALRIQQRLGNGAFGVVYKVKDESSFMVYALKDVLCLNFSQIRNAIREVQTMTRISHDNVISVIDADEVRDAQGLRHMFILTEFCAKGNLNERLARPSSEEMNFKWMEQIAEALAYLHSREVVHRDLKADNVLLTRAENVKLADFGLAREFIALKTDARLEDGSWLNGYIQYYMNSEVGPIHWMAPEVFDGHYNEKADVFSLGVLFFAILQRDFITINTKKFYGAFKRIPGEGKVGLGYTMAKYDSDITVEFSSRAQGTNAQQRITLAALQYDKDDRPSAADIHRVFEEVAAEDVEFWMTEALRTYCAIS